MPESHTELYVHLVWSTWDRLPSLSVDIRQAVYACIKEECAKLHAEALAVGGTDDHVHLLSRVPSALSVAALAKQVKGASSHLATHELGCPNFKWQGHYGAFTVSTSLLRKVQSYIADQERHHRERTTDKHSEIAWDEKPAV